MFGITRIKFQWAGARVTPGSWFLGLVGIYQRKGARGRGLAVSLRGALCWGFVAALAAYFGGAAYFWWKQERRPFNYVRYSDVLLYPFSENKRREVREMQGRAMIAAGMAELQAQQWNRALMNLRVGLDRYPRDLTARLRLAQLFLAYRVRERAQETLLQGLDQGWPGRTYLQAAIEVAAAGEDHEMVLVITERALALHDPARHAVADRRWLIEQRVRALLAEQRADDALAELDTHADELPEMALSEMRLSAILLAGRADEAVRFGEDWRARAGDRPVVLRLLARAYREAGRTDDMSAVLERLRALDRTDPRSQVLAIVQYFLAGNEARGRALLDDYIFRFGGTEANYSLAAEPLAEIGRGAELDLLITAARERGVRDVRLEAARLQVLIAERRWAEAMRQISDMRRAFPADGGGRAQMLDLLHHLVAAAADPADGAQSTLTDYVRGRQLPMQAYRQSVEVLRRAGRPETARQIVIFAEGVYPGNRYLAETRRALDAEIAERRAAAEAARPVTAPREVFASAPAFWAELDRVVGEGGSAAGIALFRELRQARPTWARAEEEALARRELKLRVDGDDIAAIQGATRVYLSSDPQRLRVVVALATSAHEAGRAPVARLLLQEVLRRSPGHPQALMLLARWFPVEPEPSAPEEP